MNKIQKFLTILRTPFYRQALLWHRVAAAVEHDALLKKIGGELKTVVDIGANRGQFALAARHHAQEAYIIAFEPLDEAAEVFAKVFQADPCVELHRCAIGSKKSELEMHVCPARMIPLHYCPFQICSSSSFPARRRRAPGR